MNLFRVISWAAGTLATVSIICTIVLIVLRTRHDRRSRSDELRRAELTQLVFEWFESPEKVSEFKASLTGNDQELIIGILLEFLPKLRGEYESAIVQIMRELGVIDYAIQMTKSRAWWRRARACALLGNFNDPAIIEILDLFLEDKQIDVRIEAARSLVRLKAVRSVTHLIESLGKDQQTPSLAVTDLLRSLGTEAVPELITLVKNTKRDLVKIMALDALGYLGDLRAIEALPNLNQHASPQLRLVTMKTLSRLQHPACMPIIEKGLSDSDPAVRAQAAFCAGQMGATELIDLIRNLLSDRSWSVRYYAAEALYKMGEDGVRVLEIAGKTSSDNPAGVIARGILLEKNQLIPT